MVKNEIESTIENAMSLLRQGIDGDQVYHPLYKAWKMAVQNPALLNDIHNDSLVGNGFFTFISFGTIRSIDDMQQLASLAYFFISKSIQTNCYSCDYRNRTLLIDSYFVSNEEYFKDVRDAFQYTVSEALHQGEIRNPLSSMMFLDDINDKSALCQMEYHDLCKIDDFTGIGLLELRKMALEKSIGTGKFFPQGESLQSILRKGEECHKKVYTYLEKKILYDIDIDF